MTALLKLYSEHRLNEDWFLRSVGFCRGETPKKGTMQARYHRYSAGTGGQGMRLFNYSDGRGPVWVASSSFHGYRSPGYADVTTAYVAGCVANWGQP